MADAGKAAEIKEEGLCSQNLQKGHELGTAAVSEPRGEDGPASGETGREAVYEGVRLPNPNTQATHARRMTSQEGLVGGTLSFLLSEVPIGSLLFGSSLSSTLQFIRLLFGSWIPRGFLILPPVTHNRIVAASLAPDPFGG